MKKEKHNNWGGFRENSGRKPKVEGTKSTTLSFSCTLEQKDLIRKLKFYCNISQFYRIYGIEKYFYTNIITISSRN